MSRISVLRLDELDKAPEPLLEQVEVLQTGIRRIAEQFSRENLYSGGGELDNWLRAERYACWTPQAELRETDDAIHLLIGVPGLDPEQIEITLLPAAVILLGDILQEEGNDGRVHFSDFGARKLFRRIELPSPIHVESAVVSLDKSLLKFSAAKVETADPT